MTIKKSLPNPCKGEYVVFVRTITYNHSGYIEECMDGVAKQETTFPFVQMVIDDASSDGSQEVIKNYVEREFDIDNANCYDNELALIIVGKHKKNNNYTIAAYLLKQNLYGNPKKEELYKPWRESSKYEAICEGDDYWTVPNKLQIQVEFLESHIDYSAVATQSMVIYETDKTPHPFSKQLKDYDWKIGALIGYRPFHTSTIMHRTNPEVYNRPKVYSGDICLIVMLSQIGRWKFLSQNTCVYRKHSGGASSNVTITDLQKDLLAIPYYLKINPHFPKTKYRAYLYYTFSIFPPQNSVYNILKYGIKSVVLNLICLPIDISQILRTFYYMYLKLLNKVQK